MTRSLVWIPVMTVGLLGVQFTLAAEVGEPSRSPRPDAAGRSSSTQPTSRPARRYEPRRLGPPQPTRVWLDVFTLTLSAERGQEFSLDAINGEKLGAKELLGEFAKLGEASLAYRFDEQIDLAADSNLVVGSRVPIAEDMQPSSRGRAGRSVSYRSVGCVVKLIGSWQGPGEAKDTGQVSLELRVSEVRPSAAVGDIPLPSFTELSVERSLRVKSGKPLLSATIRAEKSPKNEVAAYHVCIVRLLLDRLGGAD